MHAIISHSPAETKRAAAKVAGRLKRGDVLGLVGELGAGKTCFVQGLAEALGVSKTAYVGSPSFTILKVYPGAKPIYHFDFYRLSSPSDFDDIAFDDYLREDGINVVEWADRFLEFMPANTQKIEFSVIDETTRKIELPEGLLSF